MALPDILDDVPALLGRLTLAEKAALVCGPDAWHTTSVERLGIPSISIIDSRADGVSDGGPGEPFSPACFPVAAGLASSWNPGLLRLVGDAVGREARAAGIGVLLDPWGTLGGSPSGAGCGGGAESLCAEPVLAGELGAAFVAGAQRHGVGVALGHDGAHAEPPAVREVYLAVFERVAARGHPWVLAVTCDGADDAWPGARGLRDEQGFDGVVVSTGPAAGDRVAALRAGLDLDLSAHAGGDSGGDAGPAARRAEQVADAVRAGSLEEHVLDGAVTRVLHLVRRVVATGRAEGGPVGQIDPELQHALTRHVAHECAVLLKNEAVDDRPALLPLSMAATGSLAVIGEFARTPRLQRPGSSSRGRPAGPDDALSELRHLAGPALRLQFAPGFVVGSGTQAPVAAHHHSAAELRAQAVEVARSSDVALVFLGVPAEPRVEQDGRPGRAAAQELPPDQLELLRAVAEVNPRVAVVLSNDAPVAVVGWEQHARSILECWLLGEAGGGATADLLFGVVNPSGRLAQAVPGHPFGHGLSYTTFAYDDLSLRVGAGGDSLDVGFTVTNTGGRLGQEVAQVYLVDEPGPDVAGRSMLGAFAKVELHAKESTRVELTLTWRDLSGVAAGRRMLEGGRFVVEVGGSSVDIRLAGRMEIAGDRPALPETGCSTPQGDDGHPVGEPANTAPPAG